jgi:predicted Zn-dependent peptidase
MPESDYRKATLANGVTLVAEHHPHVRAVALGVWVRTGSCRERRAQNGISHFIEHMVFKGTEKRDRFEIATFLESLGGDLNAFTDREVTCYHSTVLSEHVEHALDILSDLVVRPTFPKEELERERKVLLQELSMIEESPDDWITDVLFETVWKDQPLGQPIIGNRKTIQSITRAQLMGYFRTWYRPENVTISVAGNVDFDRLRELCEKYFVFGASVEAKPKSKTSPTTYRRGKRSVPFNSEQTHLLVGFEGVGFKDPYRFDALILSFFLGGGMSSRLFQEIREKAGLAYTVDCDCVPYSDTGLFTIYSAMAPKSLAQSLEIIGREVKRLKETKLTAAEIGLVKGQLKGTILLSSDQMEIRQESLGRNEIVFGRYVSVDEVCRELDRVSPERVRELANRLFTPEKESIVVLGPSRKVKLGPLS